MISQKLKVVVLVEGDLNNFCLIIFLGSTVSLGAGVLFGGLAGLGAYKSTVNPGDHWLTLGMKFKLFFVKTLLLLFLLTFTEFVCFKFYVTIRFI